MDIQFEKIFTDPGPIEGSSSVLKAAHMSLDDWAKLVGANRAEGGKFHPGSGEPNISPKDGYAIASQKDALEIARTVDSNSLASTCDEVLAADAMNNPHAEKNKRATNKQIRRLNQIIKDSGFGTFRAVARSLSRYKNAYFTFSFSDKQLSKFEWLPATQMQLVVDKKLRTVQGIRTIPNTYFEKEVVEYYEPLFDVVIERSSDPEKGYSLEINVTDEMIVLEPEKKYFVHLKFRHELDPIFGHECTGYLNDIDLVHDIRNVYSKFTQRGFFGFLLFKLFGSTPSIIFQDIPADKKTGTPAKLSLMTRLKEAAENVRIGKPFQMMSAYLQKKQDEADRLEVDDLTPKVDFTSHQNSVMYYDQKTLAYKRVPAARLSLYFVGSGMNSDRIKMELRNYFKIEVTNFANIVLFAFNRVVALFDEFNVQREHLKITTDIVDPTGEADMFSRYKNEIELGIRTPAEIRDELYPELGPIDELEENEGEENV